MGKRVRISLANKCQLLFGAAVILILTAALAVVWLRMQTLVERAPRQRAHDMAEAWLAGDVKFTAPPPGAQMTLQPLPADRDVQLTIIEKQDFDRLGEGDAFLRRGIDRFRSRSEVEDRFGRATDPHGSSYYRYARAIRSSDLWKMHGGEEQLEVAPLADPLEMVLLIELRDQDAAMQQMLNRIYIVAAGILAGLLAIGVFWFITMRIILSPVRLLREYAGKVSEGNVNIRSDINTGDEFEQLSEMFNTMLENLKKNEDQLRLTNKGLDLRLGELAESNVALYEANKIKGEFLANVSHELRTPLNSIIGFAEVLQETLADRTGPIDEKRKRYAANIIASSRRLLDLINDLLDLAKIEAGRMEVNVAPVSVADTCEGLLNLMRPQAEKRGITLRLKVDPNVPLVHTDAGKLQQILFNFMSNAVKFTPEAGVVTVNAAFIPESRPGGPQKVRLSVSDTGPGIAPEDHQRIFEKFTQLDPGVTKEHGGTGLGLTISRDLAEVLQGEIEVDSDRLKGATFSLIIPVMLEARSEPLMPHETVRSEA
jgi:signal transduction histidine kinase